MAVNFTTPGYIEVYKNGVFLSRHRLIWEAVESISNNGAGEYEIRQPVTKVSVTTPAPALTATLTVKGEVDGVP